MFTIEFKLFVVNVSILYSLKTPENKRFFGIFRGYKMGRFARNGLRQKISRVGSITYEYWY